MIPMREITIHLTDQEIKKLGEIADTEMKDETDVEFAIRIVLLRKDEK